VMLPNIRNPFFAQILDGLTDQIADTDYQVLLGPGCNGEAEEARVTHAMIDRSMDGMILVAPVSPPDRLAHIADLVPTVVVGRHTNAATHDAVTDDDRAGAALVVEHLADLGHRRIAHIEHHETDPDRLAEMPNAIRAVGYRHAMQARGLADHIDIASTTYTQEGGYLGAEQLLARPVRPTAIFAGADIVAMGALDAIAEAGLRVPEDISVAGYDNTTFAAFRPISLTSVDQAGHQIGAHAARLLLDRIADRGRPTAQIKLSPTLVPRHSTAPPR
jgi:LacI family transcriptional regulator